MVWPNGHVSKMRQERLFKQALLVDANAKRHVGHQELDEPVTLGS